MPHTSGSGNNYHLPLSYYHYIFVNMITYFVTLCLDIYISIIVIVFSVIFRYLPLYHHYYFHSSWVFHTTVSWWSFTRSWVTAILLRSLRLFQVFWQISIKLESGWPQFLLRFSIPLIFLQSLWGPFQVCQLQLFPLWPSYATVFFSFLARSKYLSIFFLLFPLCGMQEWQNPLGLIFWPELGDPFVFQNPNEFYVSFSQTDSSWCLYH